METPDGEEAESVLLSRVAVVWCADEDEEGEEEEETEIDVEID